MLLKEIGRRKAINYCLDKELSDYPYITISDISELYAFFTQIHLRCTGYNYIVSTDLRPNVQKLRNNFANDNVFRCEVLLSYFWSEVECICRLKNEYKIYSLVNKYGNSILSYI